MGNIICGNIGERSTAPLLIVFTDGRSQQVTPKSAWYKLSKDDGTEIIAQTSITGLAESKTILIPAAYNALSGTVNEKRIFTLHYVYDSDYGVDIERNIEAEYTVENLVGISSES